MVEYAPTVGQRIMRWIDGVLGAFGNNAAAERNFLHKAKLLYQKALTNLNNGTVKTNAAHASAASTVDLAAERQRIQQEYADGKMDDAAYDEAISALDEEELLQEGRTEIPTKKKTAAPISDNGVKHSYSDVDYPGETAELYENRNLATDKEVYSYSFLCKLPDMKIVELPPVVDILDDAQNVDKEKVLSMGMRNAHAVGVRREDKVYVKNRYTGRELRIDNRSIRHGLEGDRSRLLTNGRLGSVIGNVVQNAVPINALYDAVDGLVGTYAMASYATDDKGREFIAIITVEQRDGSVSQVDVYDVTHAINGRQKRATRPDTKSQGVYPLTHDSKVSIRDLLSIVKDTFQSVLSDDVLMFFNEGRQPFGYYSDRTKFSISPVQAAEERDTQTEAESADTEITRENLPAKARNYLTAAENALRSDIEKALSVPKGVSRESLKPIIQQISDEYLRTGTISQESIDRLFNEAYN